MCLQVLGEYYRRREKSIKMSFVAPEEAACYLLIISSGITQWFGIVGNVGTRFWKAVHRNSIVLLRHSWTHYGRFGKTNDQKLYNRSLLSFQNLVPTLPTMQLSYSVTSYAASYRTTKGFIQPFSHAVVLPKTCKHTFIVKLVALPFNRYWGHLKYGDWTADKSRIMGLVS